MRKLILLPAVLLAGICPTAAQAHELSSSTARAETRAYAEMLIEEGPGSRYRIGSCRRHSGHSISCSFRIYGARGYRCGGRVRTSYGSHLGGDTVSRASDRCG